MIIYISGPITGLEPLLAERNFNDTELEVKKRYPNADIINPLRVASKLPKNLTHEQFMNISLAELDVCTHIYMMNGWQYSTGCNQEYGYARAKGIGILKDNDE